jgi:predicted alpha-1,2-mannosidase
MRKCFYILLSFVALFPGCEEKKSDALLNYVDPFLGTDLAGNINPAACVPFGMVQLGPDTRKESWEGSSGYHYKDTVIIGFTHTHISGVGVPTWGDVLFMPSVGKPILHSNVKNKFQNGYRSLFSKKDEKAHPGYYSVTLHNNSIKVELTATERAGFHCYHFPATDSANIIIDLTHRDITRQSYIRIVSKTEIEGYRRTLGMADDHHVYFVARFDKPIEQYGIIANDSIVHSDSYTSTSIISFLSFKNDGKKPLLVKVGLSQVSCEGARNNLLKEIPQWDFEGVVEEAEDKWLDKLSRIEVKSDSEFLKKIFYSALYHCFLNPQIASDADGNYRGMDNKIHKAAGFTYYNVFSLWDTYRTLHPLFTLIDSKTNTDFIRSILAKFDQKPDRLIKWELASYDWGGMIAYPAVPVIVDAFMKGQRDYNVIKAWNAINKTARCDFEGLDYLKRLCFLPCDRIDQSVSRSVEMAYDDWCIAQMAKEMGKTDDNNYFYQRSLFYKNLFDNKTSLMRPRYANGDWLKPFVTERYTPDYTESCAVQYSCCQVNDMYGWIDLLGGKEKAQLWLDSFFDTTKKQHNRMIGFYEQGNEFAHHVAYEYAYLGMPWKTQELIRRIFDINFSDKPDGLPGNDDCGQMSAWIVMSAMGIYPFCPGLPYYILGAPMFQHVDIHLENGNTFSFVAQNTSRKTPYISSAALNERDFSKSYLEHDSIMKGGKLIFIMSTSPNKNRCTKPADLPYYKDNPIKQAFIPFIKPSEYYFEKTAKIEFVFPDRNAVIHYTTDGSTPTENSPLYTIPFETDNTCIIKAGCFKKDGEPGWIVTDTIKKSILHLAIKTKPKEKFPQGLTYKFYAVSTTNLPDFSKLTPANEGTVERFNLSISPQNDYYALEFNGIIKVPKDGIYTFGIISDDGSSLIIDNTEVAILDFGHPPIERTGRIGLKKGYHYFKLQYYENCGGEYLNVNWKGPGIKKQLLPAGVLYH